MIILGPYHVSNGAIYKGDERIAIMDRGGYVSSPVDRDDTAFLLAASWELLNAAMSAQSCLGNLARGGVASDDELEAYVMLCRATDKATRRRAC